MFVPLDKQFTERNKIVRSLLRTHFVRLIPPMFTFRMEVVIDYESVKSLLHTERHVLRTLILESEVIEADRPARVTIVDRHQILLELLHRLG